MYFLIRYLIRRWREHQRARTVEHSERLEREPGGRSASPRVVRSRADLGPSAATRGTVAMLAHQVRYDLLISFRNPRARFTTFIFPVLLLVVFNGVFAKGHTTVDGVRVTLSDFYVPGILAMSVIIATYAGLVISIATMRETGVLKRRRATPLPPSLLIAGQALSTVVVTIVMSTILLVIAKLFYGIGMSPGALAGVACAVSVGTVAFACIAYAVAGLIGSPEAAQPIVQATMFPLWFVSGVFIPTSNLSSALRSIGQVFPVEHLANSLHLASVHNSFSSAVSATDLLVLAGWAFGAAAFAAWRFSWLPSTVTA